MLLHSHARTTRATAGGAAVVAALATLLTSLLLALAPSAHAAEPSMESQFVSLMNSARQAAGLRPYVVASDLVSIARQHSANMAAKGTLYHNPNLATQVTNWRAVGENVGVGPTVDAIHQAFMNSPEHKANILDHDFTQVGVGVVVGSDGRVWVTEDFRQPMTSSAPAPAPAPTHTSAPAPAPAPTHTATTTTTTRTTTHTATTSTARELTVSHPAAPHATSTPSAPHVTAAQLARQRLLQRVQSLVTHAPVSASDPLAQTVQFARLMSTLNG